MYSATLLVVKVMSYALTAASGVFGLLTEFKDENKKITTSGKAALAGIVAGLGLSCLMTLLEAKHSEAVDAEHREEVRRLQRPLEGSMRAVLTLSILKGTGSTDPYRPGFTRYFQQLIARKVRPDPSIPMFITTPEEQHMTVFAAESKNLPPALMRNKEFLAAFDRPMIYSYSIQLFRSATCESLTRSRAEPDLELAFNSDDELKNDPDVRWQYTLEDDHLIMTRHLDLWPARITERFSSIEDFPGSTMMVWLPFHEKVFKLELLEIHLKGTSYEISDFKDVVGYGGRMAEVPQNSEVLRGRDFHGYCYEIPPGKPRN